MGAVVLYDYWRSSASYRVRIALNLKGVEYEQRPINLVRDGGEQHTAAYRAVNPQGLVPALEHGGRVFTQSLAICEYLDEVFRGPSLLPADPAARARVRAMALAVSCDIHPLNNLRVQQYLKAEFAASESQTFAWMDHWMRTGFAAFESMLADSEIMGLCCAGDEPGLADCCLVPQVYNAERFGCEMADFPLINRIVAHCRSLPAFIAAAPENQPDARF